MAGALPSALEKRELLLEMMHPNIKDWGLSVSCPSPGCVIGILAPLVLPVLRLHEIENELDVGMKGKVLQSQSYLYLLIDQLERHKFSSLNWKIFTVRRDGSIGTSLLSLALMGV